MASTSSSRERPGQSLIRSNCRSLRIHLPEKHRNPSHSPSVREISLVSYNILQSTHKKDYRMCLQNALFQYVQYVPEKTHRLIHLFNCPCPACAGTYRSRVMPCVCRDMQKQGIVTKELRCTNKQIKVRNASHFIYNIKI